MMGRSMLSAGLLLWLVAAASAATPTAFLADNLGNSKGSVKAKTSSGYYGYADTEVACLQQLNYKSCRYTDCFVDELNDCPTTVVFQTDFSCCPKEEHYGHNDNIGQLGFSDKVGTCDWEISIYRWNDEFTSEIDFTPIFTDDGTALKYGTTWGTCYLNSEAEHCDDPLCERMAISIQGGLYGSLAYTDTLGESVPAPPLETCNGDAPGSLVGGKRIAKRTAKKDGAAKKKTTRPPIVLPGSVAKPEREGFNFFYWFIQYILQQTINYLVYGVTPSPPEKAAAPAPAAKPVQAKIAYDQETSTPLYEGVAAIISGPFYETSKHDSKIEETGLFEFALASWSEGDPVTEPTHRWPVVHPRGAKLRFTREHEGYNGHEGGSS